MSDWKSTLKCFFGSHDFVPDRAEKRTKNTAARVYSDGTEEQIDGCTIIDKCTRCGEEVKVSASIYTAERMAVPFAWDDDG